MRRIAARFSARSSLSPNSSPAPGKFPSPRTLAPPCLRCLLWGTGKKNAPTRVGAPCRGKKKAGGYLLSRDGPSIIGAAELDFRVRYGNGYGLRAVATGKYLQIRRARPTSGRGFGVTGNASPLSGWQYGQASRPISTARLCASPRLHLLPINLVFSQGPSEGSWPWGCLISWRASRLDAFSGYPSRT